MVLAKTSTPNTPRGRYLPSASPSAAPGASGSPWGDLTHLPAAPALGPRLALARILHNHCLADHQENPLFTLRAARRAAKRRRERRQDTHSDTEDEWDWHHREESEGEGEE